MMQTNHNPSFSERFQRSSRVVSGLCGVFLLILLPSSLLSEPPQDSSHPRSPGEYDNFVPQGDIRRFAGETLFFDISFLWFQNAANAQVGFYEKDGTYYAVLNAQTKGFVGFFTAYRQHIYEAEFDIIDDGRRLRSKSFSRQVIVGDRIERTQHSFDYNTRTHFWYEYVNEEVIKKDKEEIPMGQNFDDVLTAFYNFRNSVYGPLKKGSEYTIFTVPEKGHNKIFVSILDGEEESEYNAGQGRDISDDLVMDIIVPKEIFATKSGEMRFRSSKHYIPMETTVEDYVLLGDLHARLQRRQFKQGSQAQLNLSSFSNTGIKP
jgi:hypothetical protein